MRTGASHWEAKWLHFAAASNFVNATAAERSEKIDKNAEYMGIAAGCVVTIGPEAFGKFRPGATLRVILLARRLGRFVAHFFSASKGIDRPLSLSECCCAEEQSSLPREQRSMDGARSPETPAQTGFCGKVIYSLNCIMI